MLLIVLVQLTPAATLTATMEDTVSLMALVDTHACVLYLINPVLTATQVSILFSPVPRGFILTAVGQTWRKNSGYS